MVKKQRHHDVCMNDDIESSSSSSLALPTTFENSELEDLAAELTEFGFDAAMSFLIRNDPARVRAALEWVKHKPKGQIKNPAGLIRYLVKTPGPIPTVPNPADKYTKGRYGHMVRR